MSQQKQGIYEFGIFQLDIGKGVLLRENQPVLMQWKTFELLCVFTESNGNLLTRDELMNALWADTFVEDNNLSQHISALRKALGENGNGVKFIETVAGRGYRFLADVEEISALEIPTKIKPIAETNGFLKNGTSEQSPANSNIEDNSPTAAQTDSAKTKSALTFKHAKFRTATIFAILSVMAVGAAFLWQKQKTADTLPASDNGSRFLNFSSAKYQKIIENQRGEAAISPDGRFVVYTNIVGDKQTLWLRQLAANTHIQIQPPTEADYRRLKFSHDSNYIYFNHMDSLYRISVLGGEAMLILKKIRDFSFSPDNTQIAFTKPLPDLPDDQCGLFTANADGSAERIISRRQSPDCYKGATWSPDGKLIAFATGQSDTGDANTRLFAYQIADEKEITLSEARWFQINSLEWLPDNSGIILTGRKKLGDENQVWQVNHPGGETRQLTYGTAKYIHLSLTADGSRLLVTQAVLDSYLSTAPADAPSNLRKIGSGFFGLTWLPDGKIVYSSRADKDSLWTINPDGTGQKQLTFDNAGYLNPIASADGRYIFYTLSGEGRQHIWRMNADGSGKIQLTDGDGEQKPNVSADGKWLFYQTSGKSPPTIWKVSTEDSSEPVQLTKDYSTNASASPDGKLLAYFGRREPDKDIMDTKIMSLEDGQIVRQFSLLEGEFFATGKILWTKDGKALFYAKERIDRIPNIWSQPLDGSASKQITNYSSERIFDFGWSPDGKQLAVIRGAWKNEAVLISGFR